MSIYQILDSKKKARRNFDFSEETKFFLSHRTLLGKFPRFSNLYDSEENEFNIIRANILFQGYLNKEMIELEAKNIAEHGGLDHANFVLALKERIVGQPYYKENDQKIYIPFFSRALNEIYLNEPEKLLTEPYSELAKSFEDSCIDPFDTYGAELFNSYFTRLIKVGQKGTETAFFHYDTNTIYFVTDQGRLDNKLVLFDKYIKRPVYTHMLERITPVVNAYFNNQREEMVKSLLDNNLISETMYQLIIVKK